MSDGQQSSEALDASRAVWSRRAPSQAGGRAGRPSAWRIAAGIVGGLIVFVFIAWGVLVSIERKTGVVEAVAVRHDLFSDPYRVARVRTDQETIRVVLPDSVRCRVGDRAEIEVSVGPRGERHAWLAETVQPCGPV